MSDNGVSIPDNVGIRRAFTKPARAASRWPDEFWTPTDYNTKGGLLGTIFCHDFQYVYVVYVI